MYIADRSMYAANIFAGSVGSSDRFTMLNPFIGRFGFPWQSSGVPIIGSILLFIALQALL